MTCSVNGCDKKVKAKGLCSVHYQRLRNGLDLSMPVREVNHYGPDAICSVDGCQLKPKKKGYCTKHHARFMRYGDTSTVNPPGFAKHDTEEKLRRQLVIGDDDECWLWTGAMDRRGYGRMRASEIHEQQPHRVAYRLWVGDIPDGHGVLHKCDNPSCCNPAHLFIGTNRDNTHDMMAKGRANSFGGLPGLAGKNGKPRRFTDEDIHFIRDKANSFNSICTKFDVSSSMVTLIRSRKSYSHVI